MPRVYAEESLALLLTLWQLSYQEVHDWMCAWPALALACGLPQGVDGWPTFRAARSCPGGCAQREPWQASESVFVLLVKAGLWCGLPSARDRIIDSARRSLTINPRARRKVGIV